jgi:hypothetical protein
MRSGAVRADAGPAGAVPDGTAPAGAGRTGPVPSGTAPGAARPPFAGHDFARGGDGAEGAEARWAPFALFLLVFFLASVPGSFRRPFLTSFLTSRRHVDLLRVCSASCPAR